MLCLFFCCVRNKFMQSYETNTGEPSNYGPVD